MQPLLTHVIVSYNHEKYVEQAILSALRQTEPANLVVVDDASTDDTQSVVRQVLTREGSDAVFVARRNNRGLTASLNEGLGHVTTPFFAYFAGDDWVEPHRAEVQVSLLQERGESCVLSYGDSFRADERGSRYDLLFSERHPQTWRPIEGNIYAELLEGSNWLPAPTLMQRTSAVRQLGGYDEQLSFEDFDICLRLAQVGTVALVREPLATHREHTGSLGDALFQSGNVRWLQDLVNIERKHLGKVPEADSELAQRIRARVLRLYEAGLAADWVAARLREVAPYLVEDISLGQYLTSQAASLGMPGQVVGRLKQGAQRGRKLLDRSRERGPV